MPRDSDASSQVPRRGRFLFDLFRAYLAIAGDGGPCWSEPREPPRMCHGPEASGAQPSAPSAGFWKWFDPETRRSFGSEIATNPTAARRLAFFRSGCAR